MAAPPFIAARVTPEMKSLLRVLAEREQKTESAVVRQLLEVVLRTSTAGEIRLLDEQPRSNRDVRLYVRLDPNDRCRFPLKRVLALERKQAVSSNVGALKYGTGTKKGVLGEADADLDSYLQSTGKQAIPPERPSCQPHQ